MSDYGKMSITVIVKRFNNGNCFFIPILTSCGVSQTEYGKAMDNQLNLQMQLSDANNKLTQITAERDQLNDDNQKLVQDNEQLKNDNSVLTNDLENVKNKLNNMLFQSSSLFSSVNSPTNSTMPNPDHSITFNDTQNNPDYMSISWRGRDLEWAQKVKDIGQQYNSSHTYIPNETDCADMAVDLWNMLFTQGIKSVIVVGNIDNNNATFSEANHAWLYVFNSEAKFCILESTTGEVFFMTTGDQNDPAMKYLSGWLYKDPSDLWKDVKNNN